MVFRSGFSFCREDHKNSLPVMKMTLGLLSEGSIHVRGKRALSMVTAQMKLRVKNGPKYFKINLFYDAVFLYTLKELRT